jgi:hypothetical protein
MVIFYNNKCVFFNFTITKTLILTSSFFFSSEFLFCLSYKSWPLYANIRSKQICTE